MVPPIEWGVAQATETLAEALLIVPDPFETEQISPVGCWLTATEYFEPFCRVEGNVNDVEFAATSEDAPFKESVSPAVVNPLMAASTIYVGAGGVGPLEESPPPPQALKNVVERITATTSQVRRHENAHRARR